MTTGEKTQSSGIPFYTLRAAALFLVLALALATAGCNKSSGEDGAGVPTSARIAASTTSTTTATPNHGGMDMNGQVSARGEGAPSFQDVLKVVGGECNDPEEQAGCTAGDYDLQLHPACGPDGLFAGVSSDAGALLLDAAPPNDTVKLATLARGQIVCVQATANAGESPAWYYVTAFPAANIAACESNKLCEMYGDRKVTWHVDKPIADCATLGAPKIGGRCVSGWARAEDFEVFSNGM